jgi:hypothetical protein
MQKALKALSFLAVLALALPLAASAETISTQTSTGTVSTHGALKTSETSSAYSAGVTSSVTIALAADASGKVSCTSGCFGLTGGGTITWSHGTYSTSDVLKSSFNGTQDSYLATCGASVSVTPW